MSASVPTRPGHSEVVRTRQLRRTITMKTLFNRFVSDESGATAIEYGLIAALISVTIIGALGGIRGSLNNTFNKVSNALNAAS